MALVSQIPSWRSPVLTGDTNHDALILQRSLRTLERVVQKLTEFCDSGPVPGAYIALNFYVSTVLGTSHDVPMNFEMRPIFASVDTQGTGTVTANFQHGSGNTDILLADLDTSGTPYADKAEQFTVTEIPQGDTIRLNIKTETATATHGWGLLVCQRVQRVGT